MPAFSPSSRRSLSFRSLACSSRLRKAAFVSLAALTLAAPAWAGTVGDLKTFSASKQLLKPGEGFQVTLSGKMDAGKECEFRVFYGVTGAFVKVMVKHFPVTVDVPGYAKAGLYDLSVSGNIVTDISTMDKCEPALMNSYQKIIVMDTPATPPAPATPPPPPKGGTTPAKKAGSTSKSPCSAAKPWQMCDKGD